MTAMNTKNIRLKEIFGEAHSYINAEYTLPCVTRDVTAYDASIYPAEFERICRDPRVIVTPTTFDRLSLPQRDRVEVLASPFECGRVLETNEDILIDGKPYAVSIKGVGSTRFSREVATNPLLFGLSPRAIESRKHALSGDYAFFNRVHSVHNALFKRTDTFYFKRNLIELSTL